MKKRSKYYRRSLGRYIGKEATLECSEFRITKANEDDIMYMILEHPKVKKIHGVHIKNDWTINHLWVQIPAEKTDYFKKYFSLMRKVLITGNIYEYEYEKSGRLQAGIELKNIEILKYRKDLAKKYQLSPGTLLSKKKMDEIIKNENLENSFR